MTGSLTALGRPLGLGVVGGLRVATAWAVLSQGIAGGALALPAGSPFRFLASRNVSTLLAAMAVGEIAVDKSPIVPDRLTPGPLLGRIGFGAVDGLISAHAAGTAAWKASVAGGLGGGLGSFAGHDLRRYVGARTGLPDPVVGLAEDAVAIATGLGVVRRPGLGLWLAGAAVAAILVARSTQRA